MYCDDLLPLVNKSSEVAEMGDCGHNKHRPKRGGLVYPFRGELGPHLIQCGLGRGLLPHQVASSFIQPFGHMNRKLGAMPILGGNCDPILHNVAWADVYLRTKWHPDPFSRLAIIHMGQKLGRGACGVPFFLGIAASPSNTKSPEPRPTSVPSGILVHPAVRPQRTLAENWGAVPL